MAFDSQTFKTRALTSVVFVIIMLAGLLWNRWGFIILFTIIHFGCWYEFVKLLKKIYPKREHFKSDGYRMSPVGEDTNRGGPPWAVSPPPPFITALRNFEMHPPKSFGYYLPLGLVYITLPVLIMIHLGFPNVNHWLYQRGFEDAFQYSPILPCGMIFSIWINDTMAYIVGSLIGKIPLSKISPKKTWEGTIGGAVLCIITIAIIGNASSYYKFQDWIVIASCCAVFGTFGDLIESKLKRMAKVKDSGTLMPGHGGFLDRFDSLLVATPFVGVYYFFYM